MLTWGWGGGVFQPIILVLLDIPPMLPVLDGVVMELQDCALPLLRGEEPVCVCVVTMATSQCRPLRPAAGVWRRLSSSGSDWPLQHQPIRAAG